MFTQRDAINTVQSYAREIEALGIHLRKVILFGSFAKGTQHEWSDIDVALVADEFTGVGFLDAKLFSKIGIKEPYIRIEELTYPTDYFESGDPLIEEIMKTGMEVKA